MTYTMTAFTELPGLNKYLRMHRYARVRLKVNLARELAYTCIPPRPREPLEKAKVRVEIVRKKLLTDADNLYAATKPVFDALVNAKIIADDKIENIGYPEVTQKTLKEAGVSRPQVTVWLEAE